MRSLLRVLGLALLGLVIVVVVRTVASRPEAREAEGAPASAVAFDTDAALARFAAALRIPTISWGNESERPRDPEAFEAFHRHLEQSYPAVHAALARERVAQWSLLYRWEGRDPSLRPVLLLGHIDVVPIDPASRADWTHPPFAGVVADGYVWGRGSIDDKLNVMALLEAAEALLAEGWRPERTILLAFGHDEEVGGLEGAQQIAELLDERGWRPELVVDEGGAVVTGVVPGLDAPLAAVGIAEKGSVSLDLSVETEGGHSSAPPPQTAIGILASAIHRLERERLPAHFDGPMRQLLEQIAPHMSVGYRSVFANLWLFGPLVERALLRIPLAAPTIRTTTAATIFHAGVKSNVLPGTARAVVNFRLYPGDTVETVVEHVRRVVDDARVKIEAQSRRREASPVSDTGSEAFALLARTIRASYPDAVVGPFLTPGGTDARHFRRFTRNVYGFMPVRAPSAEIRRAHGLDERIAVESYLEGVRFYGRLMRNAGTWTGP